MSEMDLDKLGQLLTAYLDGELDDSESRVVERLLKHDEEARRLLEELRVSADLVASLPRHAAPPSIAEEIRLRLERRELLGDAQGPPVESGGRRGTAYAVFSLAAVIGLTVVGGWWITSNEGTLKSPGMQRVAVAPAKQEPTETLREEAAPARDYRKKSPAATLRRKTISTESKKLRGKRTRSKETATDILADTSAGIGAAPAAVPKTPRSVLDQDAATYRQSALFANASLDQKLAAGVEAKALRDHSFSNETLQLSMILPDETRRDAMARRIIRFLASRSMSDLSTARSQRKGEKIANLAFYYTGKPGINFADQDQRQILVRMPVRDLDGLMREFDAESGVVREVTLASGPIVVRGLKKAREQLGLSSAHGPEAEGADKDADRKNARSKPAQQVGDSAEKLPGGSGNLMLELAKSLGLHLDQLMIPPATGDDSTGAVSTTDELAQRSDVEVFYDATASEDKKAAHVEADARGIAGSDSLVERRARAARVVAKDRSAPKIADLKAPAHAKNEQEPAQSAPPAPVVVDKADARTKLVTLVVQLSAPASPKKTDDDEPRAPDKPVQTIRKARKMAPRPSPVAPRGG